MTGSCLAAALEGNTPPIKVSTTLNTISIKALDTGKYALTSVVPNKACMIALPGINNKHAVPTPINPEQRPIINVSAVNTCDTLRLLAPIARSIPISFVLSRTEIYVIIPIIIEETTNETTFSKLFS